MSAPNNETTPRMSTRAHATEQRLRDRYPQILRDAGLDEDMIEAIMDDYDSPVVKTTNNLSPAQRRRIAEREYNEDTEIYPEDFGPLP